MIRRVGAAEGGFAAPLWGGTNALGDARWGCLEPRDTEIEIKPFHERTPAPASFRGEWRFSWPGRTANSTASISNRIYEKRIVRSDPMQTIGCVDAAACLTLA